MIPLNATQFEELFVVLGCNPVLEGEWAIAASSGPCIYAINSRGTHVIRLSCTDRAGRLQQPKELNIHEYPDHYLGCNVNNKDTRLHRLVAATWLPDWNESLTVNHKDGNKHNNDYHNLEMMTAQENVHYYHTSAQVEAQRVQDYMHHSESIRGRIHITNGTQARLVNAAEAIPEGWWRGRPQSMRDNESLSCKGRVAHNLHKVMITDGSSVRYVDADSKLPDGWWYGGIDRLSFDGKRRLHDAMTGRIYITKGVENKRVHEDELDYYLSCGWRKGMYRKRSSSVR